MACSASTCQSNCYRNEEHEDESSLPSPKSIANNGNHHGLCFKCKTNRPMSSSSGDGERFCGDCFRSNLFSKFRQAVTSNAMITPTDNVLVAFSGGASSRVALQFVHEMQQRAQKNFEASMDRSLPVFGVGVAFVDESAICSVPSCEVSQGFEEIRDIVSNLAPPTKELLIVPIESVCSSESNDGKDQLRKLLDAVTDATGKEDLQAHLRMLSLQKVASENGYNRLVLGSCTLRIACHVILATVKGSFKTTEVIRSPCTGINGLVSSFVKLLREENPSRESTIVRTAGKLTPFHFNRIPEINDSNVPLATRRRQKRHNLKPNESISSESFCSICNSPLSRSDLLSLGNVETCHTNSVVFSAECCSSCQFQILPKDPVLVENFRTLLPQTLLSQAKHSKADNLSLLRAQIQDCLLSDAQDDET
ncbi:cytoplasmic tRNA 2-thiolation protein 2 isoform X2 [Morus notabilis]|uniref:cytoplasmic tRNA 2-thiolation protein 2 isoform X2 n=1 Tax=Morus notabilis TaxID=981085 RepID=UPI000CED2F79|nr:cytoplasmic tRNA 2-thiolation protein 2 isoform X2 [Morus notabilis]